MVTDSAAKLVQSPRGHELRTWGNLLYLSVPGFPRLQNGMAPPVSKGHHKGSNDLIVTKSLNYAWQDGAA